MLTTGATDVLKDLLHNRTIHLNDYAISLLLRNWGLSRYNFYRVKQSPIEGVQELLMSSPITGIMTDAARDAKDIFGPTKVDEDYGDKLMNLKSIKRIPYVGAPLYWWIGGGSKKVVMDDLKRYRNKSKSELLTPTEMANYTMLIDEAEIRGFITRMTAKNHYKASRGEILETDN